MKSVMGNGLKEITTNYNYKNSKLTREKGCLTIGLKRAKIGSETSFQSLIKATIKTLEPTYLWSLTKIKCFC